MLILETLFLIGLVFKIVDLTDGPCYVPMTPTPIVEVTDTTLRENEIYEKKITCD